jgi:hypothetical protein
MSELMKCPVCGGNYDKNSLDAFVMECPYCETSAVVVGGVLGVTTLGERDDQELTRDVLGNALSACLDRQGKYRGLIEMKKRQLDLGIQHYANLPSKPVLLNIETFPIQKRFSQAFKAIKAMAMAFIPIVITLYILAMIFEGMYFIVRYFTPLIKHDHDWIARIRGLSPAIVLSAYGSIALLWLVKVLFEYASIRVNNGLKPKENERGEQNYKQSYEAALKVAAPIKNRVDQELMHDIVDLEGKERRALRLADELRRKMETS